MRFQIPKTLAVAVLVNLVQVILNSLGNAFVIFRDGATANRSTVGELLQIGLLSGAALYIALALAYGYFSNLRLRLLVATVWLLLVSSYMLVIWRLSLVYEIGLRTPAFLQTVALIVGVTIAAFIFLRTNRPTKAEPDSAAPPA